nr:immunoglobulin light chain junction region [Macaca mulatta]
CGAWDSGLSAGIF